MKILELVQGSPDWLAARSRHNCASEAPVMMGASKHMKRSELVRLKATGGEKEFSDYVRERVLDKGHASEAAARPIVEEMLGQDLFPATVTDDEGYLLASLDGQTMDGTIVFEHKEYTEALAEQVRNRDLDPHFYWQLEQELLVSGAEKVLFVTSDGTRDRFASMEYFPVAGRAKQLVAGWKQFDLDVAAYVHVEELPAATGSVIEALPALLVQIEGKVVASNLEAFEAKATAFIAGINTDLQTDQHFADAFETVKFCKDGEDRLELVKEQALAQTQSIETLFSSIDRIVAQLRAKRLELTKMVDTRKETIRADIVRGGQQDFAKHIAALNQRLGKPYMPDIVTNFATVVKGKKTVSSLKDAVATELARVKIESNEVADRIDVNLKHLREHAKEHFFLFADTATIVLKAADDLQLLVKMRIDEHKAAEQRKEDEQRAKVQQEEKTKATEAAEMALQEIGGIQQQVMIATLGRAGVRKGGTIECIRETLAETHAWVIDDRFGALKGSAQAAKDKAVNEIQGLLDEALARQATAPAPAPAVTSTPAPAGNVVAMAPRVAAAPVAADAPPLKLGQINALLSPIQLSADGLAELGFTATPGERGAKMYRAADLPLIVASLHRLLDGVQAQQAA